MVRKLVVGSMVAVLAACGGGGTGTDGGTATGGGGGFSTGGGTATGGGTGSTGGIATFARPGFYSHRLAAGADGTVHLAFEDGAAERAFYASCRTNCGVESGWTVVQLRSAAQLGLNVVGPSGLGLDSTGRLHVLLSGVAPTGTTNELLYGTCASGCTSAASWTFVDLSSLQPGATPIGTNSTFMVMPNGQVAFMTQGQFNNFPARLFTCAANCTQLASWSRGDALNGNALHAQRDAAGVFHVMMTQGQSATNEDLLFYGRCASNCQVSTSWQLSSLGWRTKTALWTPGFAVTPSGRVYMAWNEGQLNPVQADPKKLQLASCQGTTCTDLGAWSSFAFTIADEGNDGIGLLPVGEALVLTTTDGANVNLRACDASCQSAASWSAAQAIDSAAAIAQAVPPDLGSACFGTAQSAAWWPRLPLSSVTPAGEFVVVHNPYGIVKCPQNTSPTRMPNIGRVISTF